MRQVWNLKWPFLCAAPPLWYYMVSKMSLKPLREVHKLSFCRNLIFYFFNLQRHEVALVIISAVVRGGGGGCSNRRWTGGAAMVERIAWPGGLAWGRWANGLQSGVRMWTESPVSRTESWNLVMCLLHAAAAAGCLSRLVDRRLKIKITVIFIRDFTGMCLNLWSQQ